MLEGPDSASDASTIPCIVGGPAKNTMHEIRMSNSHRREYSNFGDATEEHQGIEPDNASVTSGASFEEEMNGLDIAQDHSEDFPKPSEPTSRQDENLVQQKYKANEGKADRQMRKVKDEIEKLRVELCKVRNDNGTELSREEKLASENEFLSKVNEIMHERLYRAVSMLEVEEDYTVELEAKISKLEGKVKERDGVINKLSASAVANRSDKRIDHVKRQSLLVSKQESRPSYSQLGDMLEGMVTEAVSKQKSPRAGKKKTKKTERPSSPVLSDRRALFMRSESLGDLNDMGDMGFQGPLASVLAGEGLDESIRVDIHQPSKKSKGRRAFNKRSNSLWDLSGDMEEEENLGTSSHSVTLKTKKKGKTRVSKSRDTLDIGSCHSTGDIDVYDFQGPNSKKKKSKTKSSKWRDGLSVSCHSTGDIDVSTHSMSSKKKKSRRKNSINELEASSTHSAASISKSTSKKKKGRRSDFRRSNSFGDLSTEDSEVDVEVPLGSTLDTISLQTKGKKKSSSSVVEKNRKEEKKPKRSRSAGDIHGSQQIGGDLDESPEELLKYLVGDLYSKRPQSDGSNLLATLSRSTKPRGSLMVSKNAAMGNAGNKNATWN